MPFVTIAIANVVFYWAMILYAQFLSWNFLFFRVSSLLSPSRYRWFHLVPGGSSWFKLIPGGSGLFQLVPRFSMYDIVPVSHIKALNTSLGARELSRKISKTRKIFVILHSVLKKYKIFSEKTIFLS